MVCRCFCYRGKMILVNEVFERMSRKKTKLPDDHFKYQARYSPTTPMTSISCFSYSHDITFYERDTPRVRSFIAARSLELWVHLIQAQPQLPPQTPQLSQPWVVRAARAPMSHMSSARILHKLHRGVIKLPNLNASFHAIAIQQSPCCRVLETRGRLPRSS